MRLVRIAGWCGVAVLFTAVAALAAPPTAVITVDEPAWYKDDIGTHAGRYFNIPRNLGLSLTRGYAPFPVFFEGWESFPRADIVKWSWDFGAGTEGDELGRTFDGFNAAHVFETPGTYTVSLRAMNAAGEWSAPATVTVTILDRASANTYYVDSSIGDDTLDGRCQAVSGGCGPWRTAEKAFHVARNPGGGGTPLEQWFLKPGDRVLFRRGQTFSLTTPVLAGHGQICQGIQFGAYGDAGQPKPLIQWEGTGGGMIFGANSYAGIGGAYVVISDLRFDFWNRSNDDLLDGLIYAPNGWKNLLSLRCDFMESENSIMAFDGTGEDEPSGIFMVSSTISKEQTWNRSATGTHLFGGPGRLALLNNRFDKSGNHIAYLGSVNKGIIARNIFSRPAFGRTALRITGGSAAYSANNIHIADNMFLGWIDPCTEAACPGIGASGSNPHNGGGVRYNWTLIQFPPGNNSGELLMEDVIFERNVITNFENGMSVANTANMAIRNNLFVTPLTGRALTLGQAATEGGITRPLSNVSVYGNTFLVGADNSISLTTIRLFPYAGGPTTYGDRHTNVRFMNNILSGFSGARPTAGLELTAPVDGFSSDKNLFDFPAVPGGNFFRQGATAYNLSSWRTATTYDLDSSSANPAFAGPVSPIPHSPGEPTSSAAGEAEVSLFRAALHLTAVSPAVDAGSNLGAALRYDLDNFVRPADGNTDGTSLPDIGAFEYGAISELSDLTPPTRPANLTASAASSAQINLAWSASSDDSGVARYRIYRDGEVVGTTPLTSWPDTGLSPSSFHSYAVQAVDLSGKESPLSAAAGATTLAAGADPPATPAATLEEAYVFPNPAKNRDPVIRARLGDLDAMEVTIFDVTGRAVHSARVEGPPAGGWWEYRWTGRKASGVYHAVIHGRKGGEIVHARARFAVVRRGP